MEKRHQPAIPLAHKTQMTHKCLNKKPLEKHIMLVALAIVINKNILLHIQKNLSWAKKEESIKHQIIFFK